MTSFKITGSNGKKYGLITRDKDPVFSVDDEEKSAAVQREAQRQKKLKQAAEQHASILAEDPNAFDYDGVYDSMRQNSDNIRLRTQEEKSSKGQPKYISAIMNRADERKREQEIIYDKKLRKEREAEGNEFGDKEKFVTSAWKKKLIEDKKWEEEEAKRLAREEDPTKKRDLSGFYRNLLTSNVAMGGEEEKKKRESQYQRAKEKEEEREREKEKEKEREKERERQLQREREESRRESNRDSRSSHSRERSKEREPTSATHNHNREPDNRKEKEEKKRKEPEEKAIESAPSKESVTKIEEEKKLSKRNDDTAVADAKARYLARKAAAKEQQGSAQ